jgi:hypothetical protein
LALSQRQHFIFPAAADKVHDLARSVSRPEDPEHPRPTPYIEPIWQIWLRMLSLDCVSIPWGGRLPRVQRAERCPVAKNPWSDAKLDQPHRVTLDLQRAMFAQEWQHVIADLPRPIVARCHKPDVHALLPGRLALPLSAPSAYRPDRTR